MDINLNSSEKSNLRSPIPEKSRNIPKHIDIPKHIIQTWKDKNIPKKWKDCIPSIRKVMPNWQLELYTDEDIHNFIKKDFPDFLDKFERYPYGVQRADAFRYLYLYKYGGVYMDLDFVVKKPFDLLFKGLPDADLYVVTSGNVGKTVTNSFIAAKPGCKLFLEVYEEMLKYEKPWYIYGRHFEVMTSTGPILFNRIVKKYRKDPSLKVAVEIIPRDRFYVCNVCNPLCNAPDSYVSGLEGQSWCGADTFFFNTWFCNWQKMMGLILLILLFIYLLLFS